PGLRRGPARRADGELDLLRGDAPHAGRPARRALRRLRARTDDRRRGRRRPADGGEAGTSGRAPGRARLDRRNGGSHPPRRRGCRRPVPDPARGLRRSPRRRGGRRARRRIPGVRRSRALLPVRRRVDRTPLPRRVRRVRPCEGGTARRRPRRRPPAREHPAGPRRGSARRPRLPPGRGPRPLRLSHRGRDDPWRRGAPGGVRSRAGARMASPGTCARAAARPTKRTLRPHHDRHLRTPARTHRRGTVARAAGSRIPACVGEARGRRAQPRAGCGMTALRVAVVGGGLAGITAALECADAGADVTLFEARPRLGGATFSINRDGYMLDNGQHIALRCCTEYRRLLVTLGTAQHLELQPRPRILVLDGSGRRVTFARTALPAPLHLAGALLRYGHISPRERMLAVRAVAALRTLDPADPRLDTTTFGEWLRARGQSERAIERLWNLIALPTLNLDADDASLALATFVFRTGLIDESDACDLAVPAVPLSQLHGSPAADALRARGVHVRLRTRVERIRPGADGLELDLRDETVHADRVVAAVPHQAAPELLPQGLVAPETAAALGASPIVNVHLHYDRRVLDAPLAAAVGSDVQWIFDRTGSASVADGQLLSISLSAADAELRLTQAQLVE